jgi:hypothetical protein
MINIDRVFLLHFLVYMQELLPGAATRQALENELCSRVLIAMSGFGDITGGPRREEAIHCQQPWYALRPFVEPETTSTLVGLHTEEVAYQL